MIDAQTFTAMNFFLMLTGVIFLVALLILKLTQGQINISHRK